MKKTIIGTIAILLLVGGSFGQTKFVPHKKGDSALLFTFNGLANLGAGAYKGGFGYKKFLGEKTAIRGAISFENTKETFKGYVPTGYIGEDGYDKEFELRLEVAGELHKNKGKIDPYFGAGSFIYLSRTKYADPVSGPQGTALQQTEIKNELGTASNNFGLFGIFGIEWTINSMFSLATEYHLNFSIAAQADQTVIDGTGVETVTEGGKFTYFGIDAATLLTLAIYLDR